MLRATYTLKLIDGRTVGATMETRSPQERAPVRYSGAVEALEDRLELARVSAVKAMFLNAAKELGAEFNEQIEGEYERFAE